MHRLIRVQILVALTFAAIPRLILAAEHDDLPPSKSVEPELHATGFEIAEGPAFDEHGNLFVANYRGNGNIGRITKDGTASVFCRLDTLAPVEGRAAQANGIKVDREGRLIVADWGGARLLRISADGKSAELLADRFEGRRLNGLGDVALDLEGNIYFTDAAGSTVEKPTGSVYRYDIATKRVTRLDSMLAFPDGLAVAPPDQEYLCVVESLRFRILLYALAHDGTVQEPKVLITFPTKTQGVIDGGKFPPEGAVFDAKGRLYVAMSTGGVVNVVEVPSGKLIRQYQAGGGRATNCHFYGPYLYTTVAAKEAVFRLKLNVQGFDYSGP